LSKGTYVHAVLAKFLSELPDPRIFAELSRESLFDMRDSASAGTITDPDKASADTVLRKFIDDTEPAAFKVIAVEQEVYADVGFRDYDNNIVGIHGFIDAVVEDDGGDVWIVEHKTAGRRWAEGRFMFDFQSPMYVAAWQALTGVRPVGTLWNFFYRKQVEQKMQFTDDAELAGKMAEVQRMIEIRDVGLTMRQPLWGCNGCWYKDICHAELAGMDVSAAIAEKYDVDEAKVARFQ
jgi:hypothetical protein